MHRGVGVGWEGRGEVWGAEGLWKGEGRERTAPGGGGGGGEWGSFYPGVGAAELREGPGRGLAAGEAFQLPQGLQAGRPAAQTL